MENIDEEHSHLPFFPDFCINNTKNPIPTLKEVIKQFKWKISQFEHPAYIDVYQAIGGWQTKLMVWDEDGFYDVSNTGFGPYGHSKKGYDMAVSEGAHWAEDEEIEFKKPIKFTRKLL